MRSQRWNHANGESYKISGDIARDNGDHALAQYNYQKAQKFFRDSGDTDNQEITAREARYEQDMQPSGTSYSPTLFSSSSSSYSSSYEPSSHSSSSSRSRNECCGGGGNSTPSMDCCDERKSHSKNTCVIL